MTSPDSLAVIVAGLIESARCLGVAQRAHDSNAITYWDGEVEKYRIAALEAGAGGVDWRAMYRFQTAMRFMDNKPSLTRERAYEMADDEVRGLVAQQKAQEPQAAPKASEAVGGDWPEDASHENGDYTNECSQCGQCFVGHKRRVICKQCAKPQADPAPPVAPDALIGKLRCLGSLLQQLNAQTAAQSVHEAIDALLGPAAQEGAG